MEIKSDWTYPVAVGYKIFTSTRDDKVDEEKDGSPFEFNFKYGESWDGGIISTVTLSALASALTLMMF